MHKIIGALVRACAVFGVVAGLGLSSSCRMAEREIPHVIFHEIAWMGTSLSERQQWMEIYNVHRDAVDLDGWTLRTASGSLEVPLQGALASGDVLLLANLDEGALPGVKVHETFSGRLSPEGETLKLVMPDGRIADRVDRWYAGDAASFATMQRVFPYQGGDDPGSWATSGVLYDLGFGTPGFRDPTHAEPQRLHQVYHGPDTINVYFNQSARTEFAHADNLANHRVNFEQMMLHRIRHATNRIDVAAYEINLPEIFDALMERAEAGVRVRLLIDAKHPSDEERIERYEVMRMMVERLLRGRDGRFGSVGNVRVFANSPLFAVEDPGKRKAFGLPASPRDIDVVDVMVGNTRVRGPMLAEGERRERAQYYHPGVQMHHKFLIFDEARVWMGSGNFTVTGFYGSEENRLLRLLEGNTNNALDIHSVDLARLYLDQFNLLWGSDGLEPNPDNARFSTRKPSGQSPHRVTVGEHEIDLYFSPGYDVVPAIVQQVDEACHESLYFAIFAWSDYELERVAKSKWEGSDLDNEGDLTGFTLRGVMHFWDEWWSPGRNMRGLVTEGVSDLHPNVRWRHQPPVYPDIHETRKLHHKYMILDAHVPERATVITGSANWSANANDINDESVLFIHSDRIANQYLQEFYARFITAGGELEE